MSPKLKKSPGKSGSSQGPDLARLEQIAELMGRHDVAEIEWEKGGEKIRLKTAAAFVASAQPAVASYAASAPSSHHPAPHAAPSFPSASASSSSGASDTASSASGKGKQVVSPFVGTFYRSSKPDSDPYAREGQTIKRGDVLCIIEAMKLMNEIEAEFGGKLIACLVENGQPVEFGEPLFLIEPA